MRRLGEYRHTITFAAVCIVAVALLGAADYFGYAAFGETPEQQKPDHQTHIMQRFHK